MIENILPNTTKISLFSEFSQTLPRQLPSSQSIPIKQDVPKEENPIPLPPRDKTKSLLAAKPRHTRKHPLIIPPTSLQRTLDKVNTVSPPINHQPDLDRIYANHVSQVLSDKNPESQHFEEQIESNLNALDEIPGEQDVVDSATDLNTSKADDEKIHSHHVSCEDLLKFANSKPPSRTRGNDSDEVRIMSKVLGKEVSRNMEFDLTETN